MIPKIYKDRGVSHREAQLNFEKSYRGVVPSEWTATQRRHVEHIFKWASVSFNLRESVKLSKNLITRELGQRGYIRHIHMIFPITQGHSLGEGCLTVYDYRTTAKQLVRWIKELGFEAIEEFKNFFKEFIGRLSAAIGKKMWWFWKMVTSWFGKFTDQFKVIIKEKVTTIQESYLIKDRSVSQIEAGESRGGFNLASFIERVRKRLGKSVEEPGSESSSPSSALPEAS